MLALSGAAFDGDGALKVQVYFLFDVIVVVNALLLVRYCAGPRKKLGQGLIRIATSRSPPNLPPGKDYNWIQDRIYVNRQLVIMSARRSCRSWRLSLLGLVSGVPFCR